MQESAMASSVAPAKPPARLPYLAGLDGLRALAVIAVLAYHANLPIRGGFLGVEIFFTLSGFLITALLLGEWQQHGRIDLVAFWLRRARRLLPALFLVLAATFGCTLLLLPEETHEVSTGALAALGYVTNWFLISAQQSYFDPMVRPPLLQHLWSLAVEEQFYLLWPLVFVVGAWLLRPRGLAVAVLLLALASAAWMASLYQPGVDPSRAYYGTDTRASGLLLGAALAYVWAPWRAAVPFRRGTGLALDLVGVLALGVLALALLFMYDTHPWLYRGGFTLVALATLGVVCAASHPAARFVPALLGVRPLRWVGMRSYGIYLWHWPIFMVMETLVPADVSPVLVLLSECTLTVLIAAASYRFVELPVQRGAVGRLWRGLVPAAKPAPARAASVLPLRPPILEFAAWSGSEHVRLPVGWRVSTLAASALLLTTCAAPPSAPVSSTAAPLIAEQATAAPIATTDVLPTAPATTTPPTSAPVTNVPEPTAVPTSTPEPTVAPPQAIDPALAARLQQTLDELVADGFIPGVSLAVHIPGQEVWVGTSGVASRQTGAAMTPNTRMRIASISKVFTAVVVLQLVEEGKISLDAPVATWFPGLVPQADAITVRNLLQHTSGLYDFLEDRNYVTQAYQNPTRAFAPNELVAYAAQYPLAFAPGAPGAWDYSSTNYVILGMIVEQVSGNSLAQEMRQRIFTPLELTGTYFTPDEAVEGEQAAGYSRTVNQSNVAMSFAFGTASLVSTPEDVARFADALFSGDTLLRPNIKAEMLTFVSGKGQYNMPSLAYGLGVMRNQLAVGEQFPAEASTVYGHIGGFGGFRSALWHAPASGITIALGENQASTDPNILATRVWQVILESQAAP